MYKVWHSQLDIYVLFIQKEENTSRTSMLEE